MTRPPRETWLLLRMLAWRAVLPVLKRRVRVATLARLMWREPDRQRGRTDAGRIAELVQWLYRGPARGRGDTCLERSLLAYRYLSDAGVAPRLVVGISKPGSSVIGHAWVVVNGEPLFESAADVDAYASFFSFGQRGTLLAAPSDNPRTGKALAG